jgi:hypothetical protein
VFGGINALALQAAGSATRTQGVTRTAPLWQAAFDRNGRTLGIHFSSVGLHPDFEAGSGFITRGNIVHANLSPQLTLYGKKGALLESWAHTISVDGIWPYQSFFRSDRRALELKFHNFTTFTLRGGWRIGPALLIESFRYDSTLYTAYRIERTLPTGQKDTIPYTGSPELPNLDLVLNISTPQFPSFSASGFLLVGRDDNFFEWARAYLAIADVSLNWRPTDKLRVGARYVHQQYVRRTDKSTVGIRRIPRLKIEYQLSRPIFLRLVGQYDANQQDSLRDDSRTNFPILLYDPATNQYSRASASQQNNIRVDALFAYQPNPGTVIFAGYGSSLEEPDGFKFRGLRRSNDGFFVKLSYLLRVKG